MREILSTPGKEPGMKNRMSLDLARFGAPSTLGASLFPGQQPKALVIWVLLAPFPARWLRERSACLFLLIKQTKRDYCDRFQPGLCVVVESHCLRKY